MKFKCLMFFLFNSIFSCLFPHIGEQVKVLAALPADKLGNQLKTLSEKLLTKEEKEIFIKLKKDLDEKIIRYIPVVYEDINYGKSKFFQADFFYLGADDSDALTYSLVRTKINSGTTQSQNSLQFVPLAPAQVYLNGEKENDKYVHRDNPIYNKRIDLLELQYRNPIVTLQDASVVGGVSLDAQKRICLIDNISDGSSVKTNVIEINDANSQSTDGVIGLAASSDKIFAAVKSNAGSFGDGNAGCAVLIQEDSKLKPVDVVNGDKNSNLAYKLDITADILFAIAQNASSDIDFGDMYWDSNLKRLFFALKEVGRSNVANPGGGIAILVGRFDGDKLILEPIVVLNQNLFTTNSVNHIFGFYSDNTSNIQSSGYKIRTMLTSTNKKYLIINGSSRVVGDEWQNRIYALPILSSTKHDGTYVGEADIGKIADKNNNYHDTIVQNNSGMTLSTDLAAQVGRSAMPLPIDGTIQDLYVVNDTVFTAIADDRSASTKEAGIFKSTAIFDQNGNIRDWTPWQRVMGTTDRVYGFGFDITGANFWYFTDNKESPIVKNTVKVSQWGNSRAYDGLMGNGLIETLEDEFLQSNAGVHQIFNFDEHTSGFNDFSMLVATGYKRVALIQSGDLLDAGDINAFTPTNQFVKDTNIFIFRDSALSDIGPVSFCELSRTTVGDTGWVFAGGYNGIAVLRKSDGTGWDSAAGLSELSSTAFPGDGNWSFKELKKDDDNSFTHVRNLKANSGFMYIMTIDNIFRFEMDVNKFKDSGYSLLGEKIITPPCGYLLDMIIFYSVTDDTRLLVATTEGLFYSDAISDDDESKTPTWTRVELYSGTSASGPFTHLSFLDIQKGGVTTNGNLYVLAADLCLNLSNIYRFNIYNGIINSISEDSGTDYFYSIGELRSNFITDGALGFSMLSKHFDTTDFLRSLRMISNQQTIRNSEISLNLDLSDNAYNVGILTQNTASGGWIVPGDWGIRVNE